jgi:hypothetical protein
MVCVYTLKYTLKHVENYTLNANVACVCVCGGGGSVSPEPNAASVCSPDLVNSAALQQQSAGRSAATAKAASLA